MTLRSDRPKRELEKINYLFLIFGISIKNKNFKKHFLVVVILFQIFYGQSREKF